jgi:hypothetical protein
VNTILEAITMVLFSKQALVHLKRCAENLTFFKWSSLKCPIVADPSSYSQNNVRTSQDH